MSWEDEDDWENAGNDSDDAPALGDGGGDKWAGEDEDDDLLAGDDWDADSDEEKDKKKNETVVPGAKKLTKRQIAKKREEEERKLAEKQRAIDNMSEEEKAALKEKERKRIEKDQLMVASDLFGDMGELSIAVDDAVMAQTGDADADNADMAGTIDAATLKDLQEKKKEKNNKGVEDVELKTTDDFTKFAQLVGKKVAKSVNVKKRGDTKKLEEFLKIMITEVCGPMSLDECNSVKKHFNGVYNQKAKDPSKKKKPGKKTATVKLGRGGGYDDPHGGYDPLDDFF